MVSATVELRSVEGTEAAVGWPGGHTIMMLCYINLALLAANPTVH